MAEAEEEKLLDHASAQAEEDQGLGRVDEQTVVNQELASTIRSYQKKAKVLTNSPINRMPNRRRHGRMMFRTSSWGRSNRQVGAASIPARKHVTPGPSAYKPFKAPKVYGHRGVKIGREERPKGLAFLGLGKDMVCSISLGWVFFLGAF